MTEADVLEQTRPIDAPDTCELRACRAGAILEAASLPSRFKALAMRATRCVKVCGVATSGPGGTPATLSAGSWLRPSPCAAVAALPRPVALSRGNSPLDRAAGFSHQL